MMHTPSSCVATLQSDRAAAKSSKDRPEIQIFKVQFVKLKCISSKQMENVNFFYLLQKKM